MDVEKKPYAITEYAGWYVAGRKVPSRRDKDGNLVPLVGHVLNLTDAEAKYELLHLTIEAVKTTTAGPLEVSPQADTAEQPEPTAAEPADTAEPSEAGGGKRKKSA